ncbi:cytochrome P450 [Clathrospora elynae]|uniref:Cytochrome P450 n=1 Tax=Clathrospora elynae TaxID=706981 RepID=A0A6A5S8J5_9PLEO|nr:cytochrome P450 [Clathrospora elynae]
MGILGPRNWPALGNILDIKYNAVEKYRKWSKTFSAIAEAAKKTFRGSVRRLLMSEHVLPNTAGSTIGTSPFNESLKLRQKRAASALNEPTIATYINYIDLETKDFDKDKFASGRAGTDVVDPMPISMVSRHDPVFHEICEVVAAISRFRGSSQDHIPILRLNSFRFVTKSAEEYRGRRDVYLTRLNRDLDVKMEKRIHQPCIQTNIIYDKDAALNTTTTTLVPGIQNKALREIRKLHPEEEPLAAAYDYRKCEYVAALVRECLRFYTVLRLALPRAMVKDVVYEGKVIPTGSMIYLNAWACNYRQCAGLYLANHEIYLVFLRMLSSFELVQDSEVDVHPVRGSADPTSLVTMCRHYKIIFKPRNEKALREALEAFDERLAEHEKA